MSKLYSIRPSIIMNIFDGYTAYCFDEVCAYITSMIRQGEEPSFEIKDKQIEKPHYNSLRDMYNEMGYENGGYKKQLDIEKQ